MAGRVTLRPMTAADEAVVAQAHAELLEDRFSFLLAQAGETFPELLDRERRWEAGDVPEGKVRAAFRLAVVDGEVVGRVSVRYGLNDFLRQFGGHIGYGVRPQFRRRGYASQILGLALAMTDEAGIERVLVTCDVDNVGSARTIENAGGVLESIVDDPEGAPKRRYWIDRAAQVAAAQR